MIKINIEQCRRIALLIRNIELLHDSYKTTKKLSKTEEANQWFYLIAISHNIRSIGDKKKKGWDYLTHSITNNNFLSSKWIKKIFEKDAPKDILRREYLITDCKRFLQKNNVRSILDLYKQTDYTLGGKMGIYIKLSSCEAYKDPIKNKTLLLTYILYKKKLVKIKDIENLLIPIEYNKIRVAIRNGIIRLPISLKLKILNKEIITRFEELQLRQTVQNALQKITQFSKRTPLDIDLLYWLIGRTCCKNKDCHLTEDYRDALKQIASPLSRCPFSYKCKAFRNKKHINLDVPKTL